MTRTVEVKYIEYWVIRVVRNTDYGAKTVVKEIEYSTEPTEQDIVEVLCRWCNNANKEFISIEHNYRMA